MDSKIAHKDVNVGRRPKDHAARPGLPKPIEEPVARSLVDTVASSFKGAGHWFVEHTRPQADTAGNFHKDPYVPAVLMGGVSGVILAGEAGGVTNATRALVSVFVMQKTGSKLLAAAASAAVGAALAATTFPGSGPAHMVSNAILGAVLGAYQPYHLDESAAVRSAGVGTLAAAGLGVHGLAKMAGGLSGSVAAYYVPDRPVVKALLAAGLGVALGAGLAALAGAPAVLTAGLLTGLAAGLGAVAGRGYTQFFRNLSKDLGQAMQKGLHKMGLKKDLNPRARNIAGALPIGSLQHSLQGLLMADGSSRGMIAGLVGEVVGAIVVFGLSKIEHPLSAAVEEQVASGEVALGAPVEAAATKASQPAVEWVPSKTITGTGPQA